MAGSDPVVRRITLNLPEPSLEDNRSNEKRLRDALREMLGEPVYLPLQTVRSLPRVLPSCGYRPEAAVV